MANKRILTDKQIKWAIEQKKNRYSWEAIAEALFVSTMTVIKSVKDTRGTTDIPVRRVPVYKED